MLSLCLDGNRLELPLPHTGAPLNQIVQQLVIAGILPDDQPYALQVDGHHVPKSTYASTHIQPHANLNILFAAVGG